MRYKVTLQVSKAVWVDADSADLAEDAALQMADTEELFSRSCAVVAEVVPVPTFPVVTP